MQFYRLRSPKYATDALANRANPVLPIEAFRMPMYDCDVCNTIRTGYRTLYIPVTNIDLVVRLSAPRLRHDDWWALARDLHDYLRLTQDQLIEPGDVFGTPSYAITSTIYSDCVISVPDVLIKERVAEAMMLAGLTGFNLIKPTFVAGKRYNGPLGELYALHIQGRAWRKGSYQVVQCERCGRTKCTPESPEIDQDRWDGSDVFTIDGSDSLFGLSERAYMVFVQNQFTNVQLIALTPETPLRGV